MIDQKIKKKEKILEIHSFLTNKRVNVSLNFVNFIKKHKEDKSSFNMVIYFNLILNEIKKEIKNDKINLTLNNNEIFICENYQNINLSFKKNLNNFFKIILILFVNKRLKDNEKNFKALNKFIKNLEIDKEEILNIKGQKCEDFLLEIINFTKKNKEEFFTNFSLKDFKIIEPNSLNLTLDKEETSNFQEFKKEIDEALLFLENIKDVNELNIVNFFNIYSKLDKFVTKLQALREIHKKSLKMMESGDIIKKTTIQDFNKEIWELNLESQNLDDFDTLEDLKSKIDEDIYYFLEIFLNDQKVTEPEIKKLNLNISSSKAVLIIKRTINDFELLIEVKENYTLLTFNHYKSELKKEIFQELNTIFSFLKKINENYGTRVLKSIKIGSKNIKISKKNILSYENFFDKTKSIKIIYINK